MQLSHNRSPALARVRFGGAFDSGAVMTVALIAASMAIGFVVAFALPVFGLVATSALLAALFGLVALWALRAQAGALLPFQESARRILAKTGHASAARSAATGNSSMYDYVEGVLETMQKRERELEAALREASDVRDRAEEASRAKSQFLANMSHELRTPLNAIIGYTNMLKEDSQTAGDKAVVDDLDRILRAAQHLLNLINDVLDLSKIEAGKVQLDFRPVSMKDFITETLAVLGPAAKKNRNEFIVDVDPSIGRFVTDTLKLRQCVVNLLSNAFKFTSDGKVTFTVGSARRNGSDMLTFKVTDTGIGITQAQMATLFDAFVQADASTTRRYGGTGLGLSITRKMTRLMGGDVTVVTEEGKGSTFTLEIPQRGMVAATGPTIVSLDATSLSLNTGLLPDTNKKLALVIDDDAAAVDLMQRWLGRLGYSVIVGRDGEEGLELARARMPDMILLDIHMPRRNGWDVLGGLKADEALAKIPVVVVSVDDDRKRGIVSGASEFMTKPTTQEQLSRVLDTYQKSTDGEILVIDDDRDSGDLVERCAIQVGLKVTRAFNGLEGLEAARKLKPSAIVLDLTMPEMDGFSVLKALSEDNELKSIPVIVVSARSLTGEELEVLAQAGCAFHAKGVSSPREIAANLVSALQG